MYDYRKAMTEDIHDFLSYEYKDVENVKDEFDSYDSLREDIYDRLWVDDSVTGNASGSYTFNREQAKEYVNDNMSLAVEACREFGCIEQFAEKIADEEYEWIDVTIRCYLLGEILDTVLDDYISDNGIEVA